MKEFVLFICSLLCLMTSGLSQNKVEVIQDDSGFRLEVGNESFIINGMNWDYFPIGTNYDYKLWDQSENVIQEALDAEMSMLQEMGVNAIRQYTGVPAKWITYIYENYGIYTMLNHSFGRYGLTIENEWIANTDYGDPRVKEILLKQVTDMVLEHKDTPGLLFFLLGNENNYGLFWEGAETEDIPSNPEESNAKARHLYKLFNEAIVKIKAIDDSHPIAICNGDVLFLELIKEECPDMDILGLNSYRGVSFGDTFEKVKEGLNKPIVFTEFGADAFDAIKNKEDQKSQAYYNIRNWKEIYQNAAGLDKVGNSLGGFTFQFSDGWWKFGQTKNLDIHDNNASWSNGGYSNDFRSGWNNMNEEWFGICAKGPTQKDGTYELIPRTSYYVLKEVHQINPYQESMNAEKIEERFSKISGKWLQSKTVRNN